MFGWERATFFQGCCLTIHPHPSRRSKLRLSLRAGSCLYFGAVELRRLSKGLRYRSASASRGATTTSGIALLGPCRRLADDRCSRESVQVKGVVLKAGPAEVDEQGMGDAGGADLTPMACKKLRYRSA